MIDVHCHLNFHVYADNYDEHIKRAQANGVSKIINVGTKLDSSEKAVALAQQYDNLYAIVGVHPHHADKIELRIIHSENSGQANYESRNKDKTEKGGTTGGRTEGSLFASKAKTSQEGPARVPGPNEHEGSHRSGVRSDRTLKSNYSWIETLEELAKQPKVVAIGEIGLDYYRYQSNGITDVPLQKEVFESQVELAHRLNLPIQIHNRHAGRDILEILKHHRNLLKTDFPGMLHCFAGNMDILKSALQMGFMIGFDGNITYPGLAPLETTTLSDIAKATPLERMVTETDSPFLTPIPHRGIQNTPGYVILVGEFLAKIKNIPFDIFDQQTTENATKLFNLNNS